MSAPQQLYTINGTAFMQLFGKLHGFPSQGALAAICGNAQYTNEHPPYPNGWNFSQRSGLVQHTGGKLYMITDGQKFWIKNGDAKTHFQLNGPIQSGQEAIDTLLDNMPTGETIVAPSKG